MALTKEITQDKIEIVGVMIRGLILIQIYQVKVRKCKQLLQQSGQMRSKQEKEQLTRTQVYKYHKRI